MNFYELFLLFLTYSFLGWILEVIQIYIINKKFINRGFLIGPYCPIYGCGGMLIFLLQNYLSNPILLFVEIMAICSILEYFTSYFMQKMFRVRWWDYSDKKFNLNGRICFLNIVLFGLIGIFGVYVLNPFLLNIIDILNVPNFITLLLLILFILDFLVSSIIIFKLKDTIINTKGDATLRISTEVRKIIIENNRKLQKRLIDAFFVF